MTLRTQKLGHKDVLYAEVSICNALLSVIAQHRLESFAIRRYAIRPPISPSTEMSSTISWLNQGNIVSMLLKTRPSRYLSYAAFLAS